MLTQICLLDCALSELFAQTTDTGHLTLADRYGLLAALLKETLSEEEHLIIDRMLYAIGRGRLRMVDELSTVQTTA